MKLRTLFEMAAIVGGMCILQTNGHRGVFADEVQGCDASWEISGADLEGLRAKHNAWLEKIAEFYPGTEKSKFESPYDELATRIKAAPKKLPSILSALQDEERFSLSCDATLVFAHAQADNQDWSFGTFSGQTIAGELVDVSFRYSDLADSVFEEAHMDGVHFDNAYLKKTTFISVDSRSAFFGGAVLHDSNFHWGTFRRSFFNFSDLSGVHFENTDLEGSEFIGTRLDNVLFEQVNLKDVLYEPDPSTLPDLWMMNSAQNLEYMYYETRPFALLRLRSEFRKLGLEDAADKVTYALRRSDRINRWQRGTTWSSVDAVFQYVMFETTVAYGMRPGRALVSLLCLIVAFSLPYYIGMQRGAFWRRWDRDRVLDKCAKDLEPLNHKGFSRLLMALYYSALSAFHIGWREINLGSWLARMHPKEYQIVPTGWYRTVSTVQSVFSLYLLALWVLSYFGNPFG